MTVNTFAPAPAPEVEAPAEETTGTSRRTVLVAGGVAAALALGGAGYFLLSGGSDSSSNEAFSPSSLPHRAAQPVAKKPTKPVTKPAVKVPVTSTVPLGRDPFKALYLLPAANNAAAPPASAPTTSTPTTSGGTSTPVTPAQPTTTQPKVYKLVLTRVYGSGKETTGVFSIGGKTYVAKVGSVFGPTSELKLLSLSQSAKGAWTATIQVGDSEPVDAAKGETLYVR